MPDDTNFEEHVWEWLIPFVNSYDEVDERLSIQLAALEMPRSGTTSFIEAGSINFLDGVVDGLNEIGIRGRVGRRIWDVPGTPAHPAQSTDDAIRLLAEEVGRYPGRNGERIGAWPMLIGHTVCSDELWKAAKRISVEGGVGLAFHLSPAANDPAWQIAVGGRSRTSSTSVFWAAMYASRALFVSMITR